MKIPRIPRWRSLAVAGLLAAVSGLAVAGPAVAASGRPAVPAAAADLAANVNPFSGTQPGGPDFGTGGGAENTFPGADVPFGMVQWSPDTAVDQPGGYYYPDNRIRGFSLTHFSGAGCDAAEDLPFMPYVGTVTTSPASDPTRYWSTFAHAHEAAAPGYYGVTLDNGATTELTATQRSGMARLTYPITNQATLLVNVSGSINGVLDAQVDVGKNTISGWATSGHFCGGANVYRVYFSATFDRPFASVGTWHNDAVSPGTASVRSGPVASTARRTTKRTTSAATVSVSGPGSGAFVTFDNSTTHTVNVRVGLSYVSVSGAAANAKAEQGRKSFDALAKAARTAWNARLGTIAVTGGTQDQRTVFYTAMYHALLQPNVFSDTDGRYAGFDGMTHTVAGGHAQYANFSGWDIYRSEAQLLALLAPDEAADIAQSMFNQAHQSGDVWDRWSQNNGFSGVMVGDPYHSIVASVYAFGATGFDAAGALASMVHGATTVQSPKSMYMERPGLADYQSLGYLPGDPSTTLEYTSADFGIAALADRLGDTADRQKFMTRAQFWENLYNPANGYLQPRNRDGSFMSPFDPASPSMYVEGNGAQYTWMVPYDPRGLFNAMGGDAAVRARLDTFFTELNAGNTKPYAFLSNEPSSQTPYLYDFAGAPYRTQAVVRQALNTLWRPTADGFVGNDDLGQMAAWYVWGALGVYPAIPGRAELTVGSPLFPHIVVTRPSGQTITIDAPGASASEFYVQSLSVNGTPTTKPWLPESFVHSGGTLSFTMGTAPNTTWGTDPADAPPSFREGEVPYRTAVDPGHVSVAPGGSVHATLTVQSISGTAGTVAWSANPPAGVTVSPASGTVAVPASGPSTVDITVSVAGSVASGFSRVPVALTAPDGSALPTATLSLTVAQPNTVFWYFNNTGVSDDANPTQADLDGDGFSLSAQALVKAGAAPGGQVTAGGVSFAWPADPVALPDNIRVGGGNQTINLSGTPTTLSLLGNGTNGNTSSTLTITYADGTTQTAQVGFGDWTLAAGGEGVQFGNTVALRMPYRNGSGGMEQVTTYVFATAPVTLSGKPIASVTLPAALNGGDMHVFAVGTA